MLELLILYSNTHLIPLYYRLTNALQDSENVSYNFKDLVYKIVKNVDRELHTQVVANDQKRNSLMGYKWERAGQAIVCKRIVKI